MERISLWKLFGVFAKMGAFTIGGGYAMIPLVEQEMTSRGWISAEDIQDIIVLAQSAPGLLAVNMAVFAGHKVRGLRGSIAAALGAILPSLVIILLIAAFFSRFRENAVISRIFQGFRPAAVALILVPAVRMAISGCRTWWTWLLALAALLGVAFLRVSPIWITLATICIAAGISSLKHPGS